MTRSYQQEGLVLTYTAPGAVTVGDVVVIGDSVGVALSTGVLGDAISVAIEGVFELPKVAGVAWEQGDSLTWDGAEEGFTKKEAYAGDVVACAMAFAAAGSAATVGIVKLVNPGVAE